MSDQNKPPREFYLYSDNKVGVHPETGGLRVIEYSAYEQVLAEGNTHREMRDLNLKNLEIWRNRAIELSKENSELREEIDWLKLSKITFPEALVKENQALRAQLAHRHIIGKAYTISRESINALAGELDEARQQLSQCKEALEFYAEAKCVNCANEHGFSGKESDYKWFDDGEKARQALERLAAFIRQYKT